MWLCGFTICHLFAGARIEDLKTTYFLFWGIHGVMQVGSVGENGKRGESWEAPSVDDYIPLIRNNAWH
jgi:hypothetical protein